MGQLVALYTCKKSIFYLHHLRFCTQVSARPLTQFCTRGTCDFPIEGLDSSLVVNLQRLWFSNRESRQLWFVGLINLVLIGKLIWTVRYSAASLSSQGPPLDLSEWVIPVVIWIFTKYLLFFYVFFLQCLNVHSRMDLNADWLGALSKHCWLKLNKLEIRGSSINKHRMTNRYPMVITANPAWWWFGPLEFHHAMAHPSLSGQ